MLLATYSADQMFGMPNGALNKRTSAKINELYSKVFPKIYAELKERAIDNGESVNPSAKKGTYAYQMNDLKAHIDAVAMHYGFIEKPKQQMQMPSGGGAGMQLTPEQIQEMMNQQGQ